MPCLALPAASNHLAVALTQWASALFLRFRRDVRGKIGENLFAVASRDPELSSSENSERFAIKQYDEHYHQERDHQGLESRIIEPRPQFRDGGAGDVECRERMGGLLNFYCREAA